MTQLNGHIAAEIADHLWPQFPTVVMEDVQDVAKYGTVPEGTVSADYDEALTQAIINELDTYGIGIEV